MYAFALWTDGETHPLDAPRTGAPAHRVVGPNHGKSMYARTPEPGGHFWVDESIHDDVGLIVASIVYSAADLDPLVTAALSDCGLVPGLDEFKSSARFKGDAVLQRLRVRMTEILESNCKLGLVVAPVQERHRLGVHALGGVARILKRHDLVVGTATVHLDQGIRLASEDEQRLREAQPELRGVVVRRGLSSHVEFGLQVADLAAGLGAVAILGELPGRRKAVTGTGALFIDPGEITLALEMVLRLRLSWFSVSKLDTITAEGRDWMAELDDRPQDYSDAISVGVTCVPGLSDELDEAVEINFRNVFTGCGA